MLLQVGAVIGKEYPAALAREVAGISEGEARELFGHLCDLDLIKASTTVHGPGFAFRHPLIQEVGYAMQLRSRCMPRSQTPSRKATGGIWTNSPACCPIITRRPER
jgi:hypothetical protein